jgi:TnpA family transposase
MHPSGHRRAPQLPSPLAAAFGPGTTTMSDGMRFGVAARSLHARYAPRHLGCRRGVTAYDTITDQHQHAYLQLISIQLREACAVLDAALHHETELSLLEHVTDTAGYTEMLFGLFALEQLEFSPRIRDLTDQRLYPLLRRHAYGELDPLFRGPPISRDLIRRGWDEMHRVAASLRDGMVTSTLLVGKLHALQRKNCVHRAIQELGRVKKTLLILRVISGPDYRRHIGRALNRGESEHALGQDLFLGQQGIFRERAYEAHLNRATCLSLLINAIVVWNTRYMMQALDHLRATGYPVDDADLTYLSSVMRDHITIHGAYHFDLAAPRKRQGLRPLRQINEASTRRRQA